MKTKVILITLLLFSLAGKAQDSIVHLNRKKFELNGKEFYIKAVNYGALTAINGSQYFLIREAGYGTTNEPEQYDSLLCAQEIYDDFVRIKSLGFNTVRAGVVAKIPSVINHVATNVNASGYTPLYYHNILTPNNGGVVIQPITTSNYEQRSYAIVNELLTIAHLAGIKIILLTSDEIITDNGTVVNFYNDYLQGLTTYITDSTRTNARKALLAYDLCNEPEYNDGTGFGSPARRMGKDGVTVDTTFHAPRDSYKNEICKFTAKWSNTIKTIDPTILLTIGVTADDFTEWSNDVMNIDFVSFHRYADSEKDENYFYPDTLGCTEYNKPEIPLKRVNDWLMVIQKNCYLPWIIGECGYDSNTGDNAPPFAGSNIPYYIEGTEQNQADFATEYYKKVIQAGGQGWSWWQYHDVYWGIGAERMGLYRHHESAKPVAAALQTVFTDSTYIPTWRSTPLTSYGLNANPYPLEYIANQYLTVQVFDANTSAPIPDAHIRVDDISDSSAWGYSQGIPNAYADDNGQVNIFFKGYVSGDFLAPSTKHPRYRVEATAQGYEVKIDWGTCALNTSPLSAIPCTTSISLAPALQYNQRLTSQTITDVSNPGYNLFKGQNTLTVENVTVDGNYNSSFNVEILASNEVHLKAGTELNAGSNAHVGIAQVLNDCISDTTALNHRIAKTEEPKKQKPLKTNVANIKQNNVNASYLEPLMPIITVTPNPATNSVSINTYYDNEKTVLKIVTIFNTVGQIVYEKELRNTNAEIDISSLTKGAYIIKSVDTNNNQSFHNLIKL